MQMNGAAAIAIDGPAAAGKTVVGTRLARKMGYRFLDTGMMYRAATVAALDAGAAACSAAANPIDDKRGTVDYRIKVAGVLTRRAAAIARDRAEANS